MLEYLDVIEVFCKAAEIKMYNFFSKERKAANVLARRMYCAFLYENDYVKYGIGRHLEIDRDTVRNYIRKHNDYLKYDEDYEKKYKEAAAKAILLLPQDDNPDR